LPARGGGVVGGPPEVEITFGRAATAARRDEEDAAHHK
jgi:hypothetical protein